MQISVRVTAGAKREAVEIVSDTRLKISVKEKAEQGAANGRALELVAKHFGVPAKKVRLVRGAHSPSKIFSVG